MQDPFKPYRQGNWMRDGLGTMSPLGGNTDAKELMQLPREMQNITLAANTLIRGNFTKELWSDLAMLNAIAPRHRLTQIFIASVTAGSMAEKGQATTKALMAFVNMLVPSALPSVSDSQQERRKDGRKINKNQHYDSKVVEDDE